MTQTRFPQILIVDDDPEFGAVARELVELENFETQLTTNPEEAVEWCKRFRKIVGDGETEIVPIFGPQ